MSSDLSHPAQRSSEPVIIQFSVIRDTKVSSRLRHPAQGPESYSFIESDTGIKHLIPAKRVQRVLSRKIAPAHKMDQDGGMVMNLELPEASRVN